MGSKVGKRVTIPPQWNHTLKVFLLQSQITKTCEIGNTLNEEEEKKRRKIGVRRNWTHHGSRGSGSVLWTEIRSLTYWLNALFSHPSSTSFLISAVRFVGRITGLPISPGALESGSRGATSTPPPEIQRKQNGKNGWWYNESVFSLTRTGRTNWQAFNKL